MTNRKVSFYYEGTKGDTLFIIDVPMDSLGIGMITRFIPEHDEVRIWAEYTRQLFGPIIEEELKKRRG